MRGEQPREDDALFDQHVCSPLIRRSGTGCNWRPEIYRAVSTRRNALDTFTTSDEYRCLDCAHVNSPASGTLYLPPPHAVSPPIPLTLPHTHAHTHSYTHACTHTTIRILLPGTSCPGWCHRLATWHMFGGEPLSSADSQPPGRHQAMGPLAASWQLRCCLQR